MISRISEIWPKSEHHHVSALKTNVFELRTSAVPLVRFTHLIPSPTPPKLVDNSATKTGIFDLRLTLVSQSPCLYSQIIRLNTQTLVTHWTILNEVLTSQSTQSLYCALYCSPTVSLAGSQHDFIFTNTDQIKPKRRKQLMTACGPP